MTDKVSALSKLAAVSSILFVSLACTSDKPPMQITTASTGTLTVDARINQGSRFIVYSNDVWAAPERQPVVAGQRMKYSFKLPEALHSLRLDPSEVPGDVEIYSIVIELPGMPRKSLPLTDLPRFLKYRCDISLQPDFVKVSATGPDMYLMSTVDPLSYPAAK